jgi:hypothetical protein
MAYLERVFENNEMNEFVNSNHEIVSKFVSENANDLFMENFKYVVENVNQFFGSDVLETYNNIKEFICADVVNLLSATSEAFSLENNLDVVNEIMEEEVSPVFTGIGYGTQKAHDIIESLYEDDDCADSKEEN